MSLPDGTTIVDGGVYLSREGCEVGPIQRSGNSDYPWTDGHTTWRPDGTFDDIPHNHRLDLIKVIRVPVSEPVKPGVITATGLADYAWREVGCIGDTIHYRGYPNSQAFVLPSNPAPRLSTDKQVRKDTPVYSGVLNYFPLALAEVARLSKAGNDKHNPGQPLHWSRDKSNDHLDCIARHLLEAGTIDQETGFPHSVALAWRALANLQIELENAAKSAESSNCG